MLFHHFAICCKLLYKNLVRQVVVHLKYLKQYLKTKKYLEIKLLYIF